MLSDNHNHLPERDATVMAEQQGLFRKFEVRRVDGSDQVGGKHHGCRYFVLDVDHDQHARAALITYADECEATHPELAYDLRNAWGAMRSNESINVYGLLANVLEAYEGIPVNMRTRGDTAIPFDSKVAAAFKVLQTALDMRLEDELDAARYRWLRNGGDLDIILKEVKDPGRWETPYSVLLQREELDKEIDAARAAQKDK